MKILSTSNNSSRLYCILRIHLSDIKKKKNDFAEKTFQNQNYASFTFQIFLRAAGYSFIHQSKFFPFLFHCIYSSVSFRVEVIVEAKLTHLRLHVQITYLKYLSDFPS